MFLNIINFKKTILISLLIDLFVCLLSLFFLLFQINIDLTYIFIFFIIWVSLGYVMGRYHENEISKKRIFFKKLLLSITLPIFINIFLNFIWSIFFDNFFNNFDKLIIIKFSIILGTLSFIVQIYAKNLLKNTHKKDKLYFKGDLNSFKNIKNLISTYKKDIHKITRLKNLNFENEEYNKLKIKILIDEKDYESIDNKAINDLKRKGVIVYNNLKFCEHYLEAIPSRILTDKDAISDLYIKSQAIINYRIKRLGDLFLSIFILVLLAPLLLLVSIFIFIEDKGPILYSQKRTGLFGKEIKIFKFRTMKKNAEKNGPQWSNRGDKRITNIGKYLRLTRIDELPQLISVIRGEMSLIGPRPERPILEKAFDSKIPFYSKRYEVLPGLSGWAQVNYPYGASVHDAEMKLSYDIFYIRNFSFWLDLLIMLKTIRLVANFKGSQSKK